MDNIKEKDKSKKAKIVDIVCWVLAGITILLVVYGLVSKFTNNNNVYIFGLRTDVVRAGADSMSYKNEDPEVQEFLKGHDDQFYPGDLIFSIKIEENTELKVYDIVLFNNLETGQTTAHRIVRIYTDTQGQERFVIRADTANHESYDGAYTRKYLYSKVVGIAHGLGHVVNFLTSIFGFITLAGLIFIIFIADYLINKEKEKELETQEVLAIDLNKQTESETNKEEPKEEYSNEENKDSPEKNKEENQENQVDSKEEKQEESEETNKEDNVDEENK